MLIPKEAKGLIRIRRMDAPEDNRRWAGHFLRKDEKGNTVFKLVWFWTEEMGGIGSSRRYHGNFTLQKNRTHLFEVTCPEDIIPEAL